MARYFDTASLSVTIGGHTIAGAQIESFSLDAAPPMLPGRVEATFTCETTGTDPFDAFGLPEPQSVDIVVSIGDQVSEPRRVLFDDALAWNTGMEFGADFVEGPRMADGRWSPGEVAL